MAQKEKLYKDLPRPKLTRAQIAEIYRRLSIERPAPETELDYVNPYTLVVAVALSAQATKTIGLYRNKAKNVIKLSQLLVDEFNSEVPQTREELIRLPGVGRKTANVVLNEVFGQPTMAVDTHIFRVSNRTGMAPGKDPLEVELNLLRVTPEAYLKGGHHWVLLHGRYVCKARTPECYACPIQDICRFSKKTPAP